MRPCSHHSHEPLADGSLDTPAASRLEPLTPLRELLLAVASLTPGLNAQESGLDRDERVVIYSTAAALDPSGKLWRVPIHVCVFEPESDDVLRAAALEPLRRLLAFEATGEEADRFVARARLFLVDHQRDEQVNVAIGATTFPVGPTLPNGHCERVVEVPVELAEKFLSDPLSGGRLPLTIGAEGDPTGARGVAWLVPPRGLSVVSDLDDTVKVTGVGDRRAALANTFLREFRAVPGMAELFARIVASPLAEQGSAFHYVSLGPWQLAPLLEEFLARDGFPAGPLHLQPFRIQDGEFGDLIGDSRAKKLAAIEPLLATWPQRRFVLIGDSSQLDPEVYGELARRHPEQVALVLIRDGSGKGDEEPRDHARAAARKAAAFQDVPPEKWRWFSDPATVELPTR